MYKLVHGIFGKSEERMRELSLKDLEGRVRRLRFASAYRDELADKV